MLQTDGSVTRIHRAETLGPISKITGSKHVPSFRKESVRQIRSGAGLRPP